MSLRTGPSPRAALALSLLALAGCNPNRPRPTDQPQIVVHPPPPPTPVVDAGTAGGPLVPLFVRETNPTALRRQELEALLRDRAGIVRSMVCPFNPPGASYLHTIYVARERVPFFIRELAQQHVRVEPDSIVHATQVPSDPDYATQWALHNPGGVETGSVTSVAGVDIGAPCAWNHLRSHPAASPVRGYALVVDGAGADVTELHGVYGDLAGAPGGGGAHGWDFVDRDGDPFVAVLPSTTAEDTVLANSHGVMSAGIIAARTNNAVGVAGAVGPDLPLPFQLVSARVLKVQPGSAEMTGNASDVVCALRYGAVLADWLRGHHQGRLVAVNLSLTAPGLAASLYDDFEEALAALAAQQVLVLAATGNVDPNGVDCSAGPQYPSTSHSPNVLAVGGADPAGGPAYCYNPATVAVAAPAFRVAAPTLANTTLNCQGTSCAAPFATAVALMAAAERPTLTALQLKELIVQTALPLDSLHGAVSAGLVHACRALSRTLVVRPPEHLGVGRPTPPGERLRD